MIGVIARHEQSMDDFEAKFDTPSEETAELTA